MPKEKTLEEKLEEASSALKGRLRSATRQYKI